MSWDHANRLNWLDCSNHWPPPICDCETPDPWMIFANNQYYLTFTASDHIEIWQSDRKDSWQNANVNVAWHPAPGSAWSDAIWAPELHNMSGTWYIYAAAAQPGEGNVSHRTIVLRCSSQDPMEQESWQFLGPLKGLPDHWHIDATVFSPRPAELYCCYSGWPLGDYSDTEQFLFIVKMRDPEHALLETLTIISRPELSWERPDKGKRGINEGMTWVDAPFFRGLVYSADGSWTCDYKLGLLRLVGTDLLDPASWEKRPVPLLISKSYHKGPYGPGHASFLARDAHAIDCVFHATDAPTDGWANRRARVLTLTAKQFAADALPACCPDGRRIRDGEEYAGAIMKQHGLHGPQQHSSQDQRAPKTRQAGNQKSDPYAADAETSTQRRRGLLSRLCC